MKNILLEHFGIEALEIRKLVGYENINYLVKTAEARFIFKTYKFNAILFDLVKAESDILVNLSRKKNNKYPLPIKLKDGEYIKVIDVDGQKIIIRLLTFLDGSFFADIEHTPALMASFGEFLANMNSPLLELRNYTIQSRQFEWDIQFVHLNKPKIEDITNPVKRKLVLYFLQQFDEIVRPELPDLRKSIIHNDANDYNVLTDNGKVSGIIDFGDIVYSPLINELAVAISYAIMGKDDPVLWASYILKSYHKLIPLVEKELDLLYYLIAAQLCISVSNSAHNKELDPENDYISISEKPAWELLYKWIEINPTRASNEFRKACTLPEIHEEKVDLKVEKRHQHVDPIVSLSYKTPIYMQRAAFQYMYDGYGNTFLDAYNNIPHVGHSHPKVVEAGQRQMAKLNTNTRYVYDVLAEYSERLLDKFPDKLNKVYFVNSGSAASDLAIRLARHHTKCQNIMVMEHGYHGHTMTAIDISDYKFNNKKGPGQKPFILKTPIPDTYWGKYKDIDAGKKYAQDAINQLGAFEDHVAAFIAEPVVGCGGQVPLAPGYLKTLYPSIREQGGICISDEVQTGFGRLGEHFWGYEAHDVIPDIVILGKPMGNGHPMGAVVTTQEIADSFGQGVEFFSSFGGNPVSCAVGLAVLNVMEEEGLQQNALEAGNYYKQLMHELNMDFDCIGDIRGSGLFLGFEIINKDGKQNTTLASHIKNEMRNRHILISTDGPYDNVLKSKPPLCFTKKNAEKVAENIHQILKTKPIRFMQCI